MTQNTDPNRFSPFTDDERQVLACALIGSKFTPRFRHLTHALVRELQEVGYSAVLPDSPFNTAGIGCKHCGCRTADGMDGLCSGCRPETMLA